MQVLTRIQSHNNTRRQQGPCLCANDGIRMVGVCTYRLGDLEVDRGHAARFVAPAAQEVEHPLLGRRRAFQQLPLPLPGHVTVAPRIPGVTVQVQHMSALMISFARTCSGTIILERFVTLVLVLQ